MKSTLLSLALLVTPALHAQSTDEIVDRLWSSMGGAAAFEDLRYLTFTFEVDGPEETLVSRTHYWDKWEQRSRVEGTTRDGDSYVVIVDLETKQGKAWVGGEPQQGDELRDWLDRGYAQWVNDTYWFLAPWKLRDPGVSLEHSGTEEVDGRLYDQIHVQFDGVGLTPGDQYWLWVDRESGELLKWAYVLESQSPPAREWRWTGWQEVDGVRFARDRIPVEEGRSIHLRHLGAFPVMADATFESLRAPRATTIRARATSRDAKIIGSNVGGALITLRNDGGEVLAHGRQEGSTGDTSLIIRDVPRDGVVYDTEGAALYEATLLLEEPTWITVEAWGPLDYPQAETTASKRILVAPGEHFDGEGILLELHGFIVEILEISESDTNIDVEARIRMTCGCPTEPGGLWDSDDIDIEAQLLEGRVVLATAPALFTGESSHFSATLPRVGSPDAIRVIAREPMEGNVGLATSKLD